MNERALHPVNDWSDVPDFATEQEEQAFWATHSLGERLLEQMQPVPFDDDELPTPRARQEKGKA